MNKDRLNTLSRRERQIMHILLAEGSASAQTVRRQLPDAPGYSAVRALLARLVDKGLVRHRPDGPRYLYSPTIDEDGARDSALKGLLKTFFDNSPAAAVNALLGMQDEPMSDEELAQITALIEQVRRDGR